MNKKIKTGIMVLFLAFGVFFILAPTIMGEIYSHRFAQLISRPSMDPGAMYLRLYPIDYHGQIACWSSGVVLLGAAFLFRQRRRTQESN